MSWAFFVAPNSGSLCLRSMMACVVFCVLLLFRCVYVGQCCVFCFSVLEGLFVCLCVFVFLLFHDVFVFCALCVVCCLFVDVCLRLFFVGWFLCLVFWAFFCCT